jgi:hypothetical protein
VAHLGHQTFVIGVPSVPHYRTFMREWGCSIAVFPHVALREQPKPQPSVVTMDLRRGY